MPTSNLTETQTRNKGIARYASHVSVFTTDPGMSLLSDSKVQNLPFKNDPDAE